MAGTPGAHPWLDLAGQASICYVVQDEVVNSAVKWNDAPTLSLEIPGVSQTGRAEADRHTQVIFAPIMRA